VITNFCFNPAMARKRKNRTHLKGAAPATASTEGAPKSFIIKHGPVGHSIAQLVRDFRKVMEPNTASRLRVRYLDYLAGTRLTKNRNGVGINSRII
jgi:hypothetical protein